MKLYGGLLLLLLGALALSAAAITRGPDFDIAFERTVDSESRPEIVALAFGSLATWPSWFHMLKEARLLEPSTKLETGSTVRLFIEPPKKEWKRFTVDVRVLELTPRSLRLLVLSDSTRKLSDTFEKLEWRVELLPDGDQATKVHGVGSARTRNWRSRLFGKISERILMHQVYYPDLVALAKVRLPSLLP